MSGNIYVYSNGTLNVSGSFQNDGYVYKGELISACGLGTVNGTLIPPAITGCPPA
jgi:hypothetical protein